METRPPKMKIPSVNWTHQLPGVDPYLVWADLSKFRGYSAGLFHVAVETSDENPPWTPSATDELRELRKLLRGPESLDRLECRERLKRLKRLERLYSPKDICGTGNAQGRFWTGTLEAPPVLAGLLKRRDIKIEMNLPRKNLAMNFGDSSEPYAKDRPKLTGKVVAVIDHGCPFAHRQFLEKSADNFQSRVCYLWDQDPDKLPSRFEAPRGGDSLWYALKSFGYGREMLAPEMTKLIAKHTNAAGEMDEDRVYAEAKYEVLEYRMTHGAHVLDVAAGMVNPLTDQPDAASDADIIFVQLPRATVADTSGASMTRYVLDALKYIFENAADAEYLVINLSYGSTAGPHDGSSMLERAMDRLIESQRQAHPNRKLELVLPAGNHFLSQGHTSIKLNEKKQTGTLYWQVMPDDHTDSFLELWYPQDRAGAIKVTVRSPSGQTQSATVVDSYTRLKDRSGKSVGAVIHSRNTPNGKDVMVLIALGPTHPESWAKTEHGIWQVEVALQDRSPVEVGAWVERDDPLPGQAGQPQSHLLSNRLDRGINGDDRPDDTVKRHTTGNSLANGEHTIAVGAYTAASRDVSDYSAAGPTKNIQRAKIWPDYLAVGDESDALPGVLAAGTRSGILVRMNGTSVAAPQVARALLNAWISGRTPPPPPPPPPHSTAPRTGGGMRDSRTGGSWLKYP